MLLKKRAFEEKFAARAATIAIAATQRERFDYFIFAKVCADETAQLALRLSRAKLCIFHCARAQSFRNALFKGTLA